MCMKYELFAACTFTFVVCRPNRTVPFEWGPGSWSARQKLLVNNGSVPSDIVCNWHGTYNWTRIYVSAAFNNKYLNRCAGSSSQPEAITLQIRNKKLVQEQWPPMVHVCLATAQSPYTLFLYLWKSFCILSSFRIHAHFAHFGTYWGQPNGNGLAKTEQFTYCLWSRCGVGHEGFPNERKTQTHPTQSQSIDLGSGVSDVYLALLLCLCFLYLLLGDKQENYSLFIWRMIVMYVDKSYELVLPTNTEKKSFIQCSSITSILLCCSCKICTAYCLLID